ncbi:unnamed protein product [Ambrosiozyma monospora]|uniref:Unnamed protein product n=1 Tax=Ambrosiozyma monospora TaxID=43982 RepID=A0A9W6Z1B8_AMBMO|nr:unnamed protein product [Ambrosiozyma monospora]
MAWTRLISCVSICREVQGDKCTNNFKVTWWAVALLYFSAMALPGIIKYFYKISHSYEGVAPLWIGKGMRSMMLLTAVMWSLEYIENDAYLLNLLSIPEGLLKNGRLTIARVVLGVSMIAASVGWNFGPLCIRLDLNNMGKATAASDEEADKILKKASIIGYGNAYGSSYFLFVINIVCSIMIVNKPLGGLSIAILVNQILTLLELVDILDIRSNLISVVVMWLLAYMHFFTTGHQATLGAIHWDSAFILVDRVMSPWNEATIVLDTFGPFIIVCVSIALLTLWKIPPTNKPITLIAKVVSTVTSLLIYQLCLTLSTLIMANNFRRHLMVWKIFAPRFMLNAMILILMNFILTGVTVFFASRKVIKRWYEVFGA